MNIGQIDLGRSPKIPELPKLVALEDVLGHR